MLEELDLHIYEHLNGKLFFQEVIPNLSGYVMLLNGIIWQRAREKAKVKVFSSDNFRPRQSALALTLKVT